MRGKLLREGAAKGQAAPVGAGPGQVLPGGDRSQRGYSETAKPIGQEAAKSDSSGSAALFPISDQPGPGGEPFGSIEKRQKILLDKLMGARWVGRGQGPLPYNGSCSRGHRWHGPHCPPG